MDLTSASQIETFEACARKGALKYVARVETKQNASAALGTEIDDEQLQPFLREGRALDQTKLSGKIAHSILEWLPPAGSCGDGGIGQVQRHFTIPSPNWVDGVHCGLGYQGYTDLWLPNGGGVVLPAGVPPTVDGFVPPIVADFKSTKNFKWAKTADALKTDVQAVTYAFWTMYETRKPVVDLVWLYMRTEGARQGKRVHLRVHASDVAKAFVGIDDRARVVHALKKSITDPMLVPPNPEHCEAFGGCPYRDKCNLGPGEIADAMAAKARKRREMSNAPTAPTQTLGLLAKLKAQREGTAPAPTATPAPTAPATAVASPAPTASALTATQTMLPGTTIPMVGINPPEKELPPAPPVGTASAEAKRGPGRPKKTDTPAPSSTFSVDVEVSGGTRVKATWGKEKISPISYNDFDVGPFEVEGFSKPGETLTQAHDRLYSELCTLAEAARAKKAASFSEFVQKTGVCS